MKLKTWLFMNDMTIGTFAQQTGYNRTYLGQIMSGKAIPGRRCSEALEKATDGYITAKELLDGKF